MTSDTILTILARISAANHGNYNRNVADEIHEICNEHGIDYDVLYQEQRRVSDELQSKQFEQGKADWKAAMESGDY